MSLEAIGKRVGKHESTVSHWLKKYGLEAAIKSKLVAEAGGKCVICGYHRCQRALQFHHLDPRTKEFHLGHTGVTRSLARCRAEARKCILLCANCHAEVEAGITAVPLNSVPKANPE